jgi:hypothetical protein
MNEELFQELWEAFTALGAKGLGYSHYDLSEKTKNANPVQWKLFLMDPRVTTYIRSEMDIIRGAAINTMIQTSPDSRSVGQSQLLNALQKIDDDAPRKEGPAFIYCHVPLNNPQKAAPNVRTCNADGIEITNEGVCIIDEA